MNYEKLTVERFQARLIEGTYRGLTGAKRAIGKTDWPDNIRKKALKIAEGHFAGGGASAPAGPNRRDKVATKKPAVAKPAKVAAKPGRPAKAAKPSTAIVHIPAAADSAPRPTGKKGPLDLPEEGVHVRTLAELIECIDTYRNGVNALSAASERNEQLRSETVESGKKFRKMLDYLGMAIKHPFKELGLEELVPAAAPTKTVQPRRSEVRELPHRPAPAQQQFIDPNDFGDEEEREEHHIAAAHR